MRILILALFTFLTLSCGSKKTSDKENISVFDMVRITTPQGDIVFKLYNETPVHKASFIKLVDEGYFNSYTFNRVINNFVAQGGCPDTPEGFSDSPYLLNPEFNPDLRHVYGAVGAGRDDNPKMLSAGCQFYIVQNKKGLHRLDDKYTVFGQVISGMDIIDTIVKVKTDSIDQPLVPIPLKLENFKLDSAGVEQLLRLP